MGLMVTLQHVTKLPDGRFRFRRRFPADVREGLGWEFIRTSDGPLSGAGLRRWHPERESEFDRLVSGQRALTGGPNGTPMELHKGSRERVRRLLEGVQGLDEEDARSVLADMTAAKYHEDGETGEPTGLSRSDAVMIDALLNPDAPCPPPTTNDAKRLYLQEKVGDPSTERGRKNRNDVDRVFRLMNAALGDRAALPLTSLRDADARAVRDHMMQRTKAGAGGLWWQDRQGNREGDPYDFSEEEMTAKVEALASNLQASLGGWSRTPDEVLALALEKVFGHKLKRIVSVLYEQDEFSLHVEIDTGTRSDAPF